MPTATGSGTDLQAQAEGVVAEHAERLGATWGIALKAPDRHELAVILERYLLGKEAEAQAKTNPLDASLNDLQTVEELARKLVSTLIPAHGSATSDARDFALGLLERELEKVSPGTQKLSLHLAWSVVGGIAEAAHFARGEADRLTADDGMTAGRAWAALVQELTTFGTQRGLPIGARKDDLDRRSPFVAFVHELQLTLAPSLQEHMQSTQALSAAIARARDR